MKQSNFSKNTHLIHARNAFLAMIMLLLPTARISAANLFWDAGNTNNGPAIDPGSGAWDTDTTTNFNWNNGSINANWKQTGTTTGSTGAIFQGPDAAPGTYHVSIDGGQVAATNLVINASGYVFTGSPIYLNAGPLPLLMVSNGVNVIFSNNLTGASLTGNNGNAELRAGDNGPAASVTIYGALTGWQPQFTSTNGSVFYFANPTATVSSEGTATFNADVRITNGTWNSSGAFVIGRVRGASSSQPNNSTGKVTLDGPNTILNHTSDYISIGRDSAWNATLNIQNGATVNYQTGIHNNNVGLGIPRPGSSGANNQSWVNIYGGTLNMGPGADPAANPRTIFIANGGSAPGEISVLTQTGGVIYAWGGIQFGGSGTYNGGTAGLTNAGGFLYIGNYGGDGLKNGGTLAPTNYITFSGGTIGALGSWHSPASLPITLSTLNGNVTFQCADNNGTPYNIALDQPLSGPGGFFQTGGGQLTLNGINTYAGSTVISNGTLNLTTASTASSNGPVTLDGSMGSPNLVLHVSNAGQYWSIGSMTFASGFPQIDFQWAGVTPSTTVAPVHINGDLNFTAPPNVLFTNASQLFTGIYPLLQYSGTLSGTLPANLTFPASFTPPNGGYLSNSPAAKTVYLVITSSPVSPNLSWQPCTGVWDFSNLNWIRNGSSVAYSDGSPLVLDDTPSCTNVVVTLNTTVSPYSLTFANFTNAYTIVGTGNIAGNASLALLGSAPVTLAATNTYSGGTLVSGGSHLNINSSGNPSGSPIGTGTLTLNPNAQLGNNSGSAVALLYPVSGQWNGGFSYVGPNDLDLGAGSITLGQNTTINVVTNNLTVEGSVSDNSGGYGLNKTGNGTLTLAGNNNWSGLLLSAGQINFNSSGAAGYQNFTFLGGTVDNTSGSSVTLTASGYQMSALPAGGVFTFLGTTNLDVSSGPIAANNGSTIVFNIVSNTLRTAGVECGNTVIVKNGNGIWALGGADVVNTATVTVNQGEFDMARDGGNPAIGTGAGGSAGGSHGLVVNSNALAKITGSLGNQISHAAGGNSYVEVILNTGTLDLNGQSQAVDMISMTNGVLLNSAPGSYSVVTVTGTGGNHPTNAITLTGANCGFAVPSVDSLLEVNSIINGSGTLVKTGLGTVTLDQSNRYTGNITVSAGTLNLAYPDIASNAVVTISNNAVMNLNFPNSDTNTIAVLTLNGTDAAAGLHNNLTDPAFITGSGNFLVIPPPPINPLPGTIQVRAAANTLNLAWPTNGGWLLQAQTNSLGHGLGTNWITITGSDSITNLALPINSTNGSTFYRMVHP